MRIELVHEFQISQLHNFSFLQAMYFHVKCIFNLDNQIIFKDLFFFRKLVNLWSYTVNSYTYKIN